MQAVSEISKGRIQSLCLIICYHFQEAALICPRWLFVSCYHMNWLVLRELGDRRGCARMKRLAMFHCLLKIIPHSMTKGTVASGAHRAALQLHSHLGAHWCQWAWAGGPGGFAPSFSMERDLLLNNVSWTTLWSSLSTTKPLLRPKLKPKYALKHFRQAYVAINTLLEPRAFGLVTPPCPTEVI